MISGIPHFNLDKAWPEVEPFISRYLEKSKEHRWDLSDMKEMLTDRDMQLWVIHDGSTISTVVITQILNYPRCRECNIFMVCGELLEDWRENCDEVLRWASEAGCHYASAMARRGFAKAMDWDERQTYIVRTL